MKKIMIIFLVLTPFFGSSQTNNTIIEQGTPEEPAEYPGGHKEMRAFIQKNLHYPKEGMCFEGRVYIKIDVDSCGYISNFVVKKGFNEIINQEALRIVNRMPKVWIPAKFAGRPVNSKIVIPILFKIE